MAQRQIARQHADLLFGKNAAIRQGVRQLYFFQQPNVAAAQSAVALDVAGATGVTGVTRIRKGHVTGVSVFSNAARTADTLTVDVTINGTVTGLQAVLDGTNTTSHQATQAVNLDTADAGAEIGVKITTGAGWTPTTADIVVCVEVTDD